MALIISRYGYSESIDDPSSDWITRRLIEDLRTEQFDEPDDEHEQVSVGNEHWSVTAQVSGLITLDNLDLIEGLASDLPAVLHLRDVPDEQLVEIWRAIVRNDQSALLSHGWKAAADLPSHTKDYYRSDDEDEDEKDDDEGE
jgi:hypothetical protein